MTVGIHRECPKCHGDRTMLESCFGLPGYIDPSQKDEKGDTVKLTCAIPVRLILCPRCHLVELYHDVGGCKLT